MTSDGTIDYIYDLFDRIESMRWSCKNCNFAQRQDYQDIDFTCSGVVKRPSKTRPYDVIRFCQKSLDSGDFVEQIDMTPDEALHQIKVLSSAVSHWIENNDKYIAFMRQEE